MTTGTAGGPMWQCSGCKGWFYYNQSHVCNSYQFPQTQYYTYQPYIDHAVLERIAKALEEIATQLTLRATDAEDSAPSQAVPNAETLSTSDGFAVPTRRS